MVEPAAAATVSVPLFSTTTPKFSAEVCVMVMPLMMSTTPLVSRSIADAGRVRISPRRRTARTFRMRAPIAGVRYEIKPMAY